MTELGERIATLEAEVRLQGKEVESLRHTRHERGGILASLLVRSDVMEARMIKVEATTIETRDRVAAMQLKLGAIIAGLVIVGERIVSLVWPLLAQMSKALVR